MNIEINTEDTENENENENEFYIPEDTNDLDSDIDLDIGIIEEEIVPIDTGTKSKHKEKGKHSLQYDSIFKGKKDEEDQDDPVDEYFIEDDNSKQNFDPDTSSSFAFERENPTEYYRLNKLREQLHHIVENDLKISLKGSRRKPSRLDFNSHYARIIEFLDTSMYSYSEIFIEFSFYFSDNIENMFKLLDKKYGQLIANELARKGNIKGAKRLGEIDFL